jgi:hydrogen peroxide-dependent heme synthase
MTDLADVETTPTALVAGDPAPLSPKVGWGVLHLFFTADAFVDGEAAAAAIRAIQGDDKHQAFAFAVLGHKADIGVMALGPNLWRLRKLQTELVRTGLTLVDSYFSMTEVSEYTKGMPEEHIQARLYPNLPPVGMRALCFYPMSKRRGVGADDVNWFRLPFEDREALMREHGTSGRKFAGRIAQMITGSTGLDDFEWAVTLFAHDPADLKEVVYTMRFDQASAAYGDFGMFLTGMIAEPEELFAQFA